MIGGPAQVELFDHHRRQIGEHRLALCTEGARHGIENAQRSQPEAVGRPQRRTRVEADVRPPADQRKIGETRVGQRIGDNHHLIRPDGMGADGFLTRTFADGYAVVGLEPLASRVHE